MLTSPRAVEAVARIGLDPAWRVLALAPKTAAAARAAGFDLAAEIQGGAADLVGAARVGTPVICATSDLGGAEVLSVRPDACVWVVYRTACPSALPVAALDAMKGPFDVLFTSPSAVRHFERLAPGALARASRVLCHGRTTLEAVAEYGRVGEAVDVSAWPLTDR